MQNVRFQWQNVQTRMQKQEEENKEQKTTTAATTSKATKNQQPTTNKHLAEQRQLFSKCSPPTLFEHAATHIDAKYKIPVTKCCN